MGEVHYCTACLITKVKMYSYRSTLFATTTSENFSEMFLKLLRVYTNKDNCKPSFCYECVAVIKKFAKFVSKCHRAQDVLLKLKQDNNQINMQDLQCIIRVSHNLVTTISATPTECITVGDVQQETSITVFQETFDTSIKQNLNINNTIDIDIIKSEDQDINGTHNYENDYTQSILDESNNFYDCNVENNPNKKRFSKNKQKNRKRKQICTKDTVDCLSDNEPLANKISKTINKDTESNGVKKAHISKNFDVSYFDDYATVIFLTPEDAKKELLLRKESSNYVNSPFKCEFCYRGYEAKTAFENHMKKHSNDYGDFKCDICHLRFPEQRCLCKHRLASHKRKFCCKLCPYVCFCTHQAKTHVSLHKGKKYPCTECGDIFSMPNSLLMHKRLKHSTECVCEFCGDTFATPRGLYSHAMKVHRQDNNEKLGPKCKECSIHFATEEAWKRHLVLSSKHSVSNGCKSCGETFPNAEDLKRHSRAHARKHAPRDVKLPSSCSICDKYLVDRAEYKSHMTSTHPSSDIAKKLHSEELTPFVCELCGLAFKKQCFLRYHQRKHTGERPYSCAECNKWFRSRAALAAHRARHDRRARLACALCRRTFSYRSALNKHMKSRLACALCRRTFSYRSALNKHMKVHLNIRPHKCDICDKSFISPCDVRLHIKYVHNKVPWPKRNRNKKNQDTFEQYS